VAFVISSCYIKKSFQPSFKQSSIVAAALWRKIDETVSCCRVSGGADPSLSGCLMSGCVVARKLFWCNEQMEAWQTKGVESGMLNSMNTSR